MIVERSTDASAGSGRKPGAKAVTGFKHLNKGILSWNLGSQNWTVDGKEDETSDPSLLVNQNLTNPRNNLASPASRWETLDRVSASTLGVSLPTTSTRPKLGACWKV